MSHVPYYKFFGSHSGALYGRYGLGRQAQPRHLVDRKDRRDKSYFRIGWDWLEHSLSQGFGLRLQFSPYV
jgi:hypothetical protein